MHINKPSYLTIIGVLMFLAAFIIGDFVLFPASSVLLGENLLESESGNLTSVGSAIIYSPYLAAFLLILYDLLIRKPQPNAKKLPYKKIWLSTTVLGVIMALIGTVSLLTYDQDKGANIGAGMLILAGGSIIVIGLFIFIFKFIFRLLNASLRKKH